MRWWPVGAVALGVVAAGVGFGWLDGQKDGPAWPVPLRVGWAEEAPYAFLDADGRVTGEAPEAARAIAERLGLGEPDWVLAEFGSLIGQLRSGRFDVIAAGLFVTPEREELVAFSRPTLQVSPGLLVARGNPRGFSSYADAVKLPDVRLAAVAESVEAQVLLAEGLPLERLALVPDPDSGVALVKAGRVEGLALSQPTVRWWASLPDHADKVESVEPFQSPPGTPPARVAFAFRHEDVGLRDAWDAALADYLASGERTRTLRQLGLVGDGAGGQP